MQPPSTPTAPAAPTPPAPELYPGYLAELERRTRRIAATEAAAGEPLPGPLLDAFSYVPETIAGLTVRPLVHFDFVILRKLDSPLLKQLSAGSVQTGQGTPFTDQDGYDMVLQFTRPVREMAALVGQGKDAFRRAALEQIGMTLGPVEVGLLVKAVEKEFIRAFSTAIKYSAKPVGEGSGTVFTVPPAPPTTASAGGSTTSAS